MKETDLYPPVKALLVSAGYEVHGEVKDADVAAVKDGLLTIVELKTSFNLKLVLQAAERQKLTGSVYAAIPRPKYKKRFGRDFKDKADLLKRLGVGLIFVNMDADPPYAQVVFDANPEPAFPRPSRYSKRVGRLRQELASRSGDYNAGGTNGPIMTAYKEQALAALSALAEASPQMPKELKKKTGNPKVGRLLIDNHYGWFERTARGWYAPSQAGLKALDAYGAYLAGLPKTGNEPT